MAVLPFFSDNQKKPLTAPQPVNMFAAPTDTATSTTPQKAPAPVGFVQDTTSPFFADPAKLTQAQRGVSAAQGGLQAGASVRPTESGAGAAVQALGAAASGAASGFMVGGPVGAGIGAGVGLLMGGLNAFIGNAQARKERDRLNTYNREARKLEAERVAKDEAWKQKYFLQTIEQARYERRKYASQNAWERAQAQGVSMKANINNNANLKERYAKLGYV